MEAPFFMISPKRPMSAKKNPRKKSPEELLRAATDALQGGDISCAEAAIVEILHQKPNHPDALAGLGLIHHIKNQPEQAEKNYRRALAVSKKHLSALKNLGLLLHQTSRHEEAIQILTEAINLRPNDIETLNNLGTVHQTLGNYPDAKIFHEKARLINPNHPATLTNLGSIAQHSGNLADAARFYQQALVLAPNFLPARVNLGKLRLIQRQYGEALLCLETVLAQNPRQSEAFAPIAAVLLDFGRTEEGLDWLRKAVSVFPKDEKLASSLAAALQYHPHITANELRSAAERWWRSHGSGIKPAPLVPKATGASQLKIGYLSPDFRDHPVSYFLLPVLFHHHRDKITVHCFSAAAESTADTYTEKIKAASDHWHPIAHLSDDEAARLIADCGIDILVDVSGHTNNNRLLLFARRPAPVQVSWLGYQGTTGMPVMDYRISDPVADPPGQSEAGYSEKLIRLPHAFFCFEPPENAPEILPLPADEVGHITMGSVNNHRKISPAVIELWAKVLHRIPDAVLLISNHQVGDGPVRDYCLTLFARQGIPASRLRFQPSASFDEYLRVLSGIDFILDTFPLNGHTVSCQALWMGAPIVTLAGERFGSRIGATTLHAIGLKELVADSADRYVEIAGNLAANRTLLRELRVGMRARMMASPICDASSFTTHLEECFTWHRQHAQRKRT